MILVFNFRKPKVKEDVEEVEEMEEVEVDEEGQGLLTHEFLSLSYTCRGLHVFIFIFYLFIK